MAGSSFGTIFRLTTWGESHGKGVGVVVDGVPAGLSLSEEDIQVYLDRRKPGQNRFTTKRKESDTVQILSGTFEGKTTGTPISMVVWNEDQHSKDYSDIASYYRPGHADYTFDAKYGFRDYRGGGRSSGRETIARVAAGAIALKMLSELGITVSAYTRSIGDVEIQSFDAVEIANNALNMPDAEAAEKASELLTKAMAEKNSVGGVVECVVHHMPAGVGDPVFEKLDANLAKALVSIGAVKGVEIGDGFSVCTATGLTNNDAFHVNADGSIVKLTNHSGGIQGGISNGQDIYFRVAFKPVATVLMEQHTVNLDGTDTTLKARGRHDPCVLPRAVPIVEAMTAMTLLDFYLIDRTTQL
mgnify:CR=1 FL=1